MKYDQAEIEKLYKPWSGNLQFHKQISKAVWYVGVFPQAGEVFAKHRLFLWNKQGYKVTPSNYGNLQSLSFLEKSLDAALEGMKNCIVLSTTPTYYSQFQSACLLKSRGFELLQGKCYDHPDYTMLKLNKNEHPGAKDGRQHWEHIWWKVVGKPEEIGQPTAVNQLHNCGVDSLYGWEMVKNRDSGPRRKYLAVAWLPRGVPFPKGWKRFFSGTDYKLGVNFDSISGISKVQECPHNFDLSVFKDWEPDFEMWSPG